MKDWFLGLEPRERRLVTAGGVVLALLLVYLVVWEPLAARYRQLQDSVAQQRETLAWMQQAAAQVKALQRSVPGGGR
ncbi:MAG TPA: type II secretion system protein M, partial [Gammaproteobacteria bacterium]|nr:type II secretion system protein M [Gammaproteobacteria bacterium]